MRRIDRLRGRPETRYSIDDYLADLHTFGFDGSQYQHGGLNLSLQGSPVEELDADFVGFLRAAKANPVAFAATDIRASLLAELSFVWRNTILAPLPGRKFGTDELTLLERPWPGGRTGDLVSRMEWHASLAGNAYVLKETPTRLKVLRPDWVRIIVGSHNEPDEASGAVDGEVVGYVYQNGGFGSKNQSVSFPAEMVAHWAPIPDPAAAFRGMSWFTPILAEVNADRQALKMKDAYFKNAFTPNLVIKGIRPQGGERLTPEQFQKIVRTLEEQHAGASKAFKTLYLTEGADATVVGANLKDVDFKSVIAAGETRVAVASQVPAAILNISEGMQGSGLNQGNFAQVRRKFADTWFRPQARGLCSSLATLFPPKRDAELWFDDSDIAFLREDEKDAAEILNMKAAAIRTLTDGGYDPGQVVDAVNSGDLSTLTHSGLLSVQLLPPGTEASPQE